MKQSCKWCSGEIPESGREKVYCSPDCQADNYHFVSANDTRKRKGIKPYTKAEYKKHLEQIKLPFTCQYCGLSVEVLIDDQWCSITCSGQAFKLNQVNLVLEGMGRRPLTPTQFQEAYLHMKYSKEVKHSFKKNIVRVQEARA